MKMKQVYESNPALGDPMSIQGQLTDNGQRLDKLRAEQKKFQVPLPITFYITTLLSVFLKLHLASFTSLINNDLAL